MPNRPVACAAINLAVFSGTVKAKGLNPASLAKYYYYCTFWLSECQVGFCLVNRKVLFSNGAKGDTIAAKHKFAAGYIPIRIVSSLPS